MLIKPAAGDGGDGMRVVRDAVTLAEAVASTRQEVGGEVFCEPYVENARHIEVPILADAHGAVVPFGERECSVQRRYQKIIEETPSPAVDPALREELCRAAIIAVRAIGYVGVGTVEFLLDADGDFWFLELTPSLQVEHAVTECVSGYDLVRLQLLVAEGGSLPMPGPPPIRGHAIEVRLCAEDPAYAWLPAAGTLHRFAVPDVAGSFRPLPQPGLRLDSGVTDGSVVGMHHDPMLAKLIAWAPTRQEAARMLASALARTQLHGVVSNRDLLVRVLRHHVVPGRRRGHRLPGPASGGLRAAAVLGGRGTHLMPGRGARRGGRPPGAAPPCSPPCPRAGATSRPARRPRSTTARPARSRWATG